MFVRVFVYVYVVGRMQIGASINMLVTRDSNSDEWCGDSVQWVFRGF